MSNEHILLWLKIWYVGACVLWTLATYAYTRQYLRAIRENKKHTSPFLLKAVSTATIGLMETGFYSQTLLFTDSLFVNKLALMALPVGITLQAVIYIVIGVIVTHTNPGVENV